jgi:acetylornithine deacetylase/succinyl-diaminopimelate desuccinylase-like protein
MTYSLKEVYDADKEAELLLKNIRQDSTLDLLHKLVKTESVSNHESDVADLIYDQLSSWGLHPRKMPVSNGRYNIICEYGKNRGKTMMLNSHIDTVPSDPKNKFGISEGRFFGRGSSDAKGSVTSMMIAMKTLADADVEISGKLTLALVVGEEVSGDGTYALVTKNIVPDIAIVGEPTNLSICPTQSGYVSMRIKTESEATHGFTPDPKPSATDVMIEILHELKSKEFNINKQCPEQQIFFRYVQAGKNDNFWFNPDTCKIRALLSTSPYSKNAAVINKIKDQIESLQKLYSGVTIGLTVDEEDAGVIGSKSSCANTSLHDSAIGVLGSCEYKHMTSWTDASILFAGGVDCTIFGPGDLAVAHTGHEYVELQQVVDAIKILVLTSEKSLR